MSECFVGCCKVAASNSAVRLLEHDTGPLELKKKATGVGGKAGALNLKQ